MTMRDRGNYAGAKRLATFIPGALVLFLAACGGGDLDRDKNLLFRNPVDGSPTTIVSRLSPPEVARAFKDAGFPNVTIRGGGDSVRVNTNTVSMIDCGKFVQTALGNRAEFSGAAPLAAIFSPSQPKNLLLRSVTAVSQLDLTRSGNAYVVQENHVVTVEYSKVGGRAVQREVQEFDAVSMSEFADKTACRSAGIAAQVLN